MMVDLDSRLLDEEVVGGGCGQRQALMKLRRFRFITGGNGRRKPRGRPQENSATEDGLTENIEMLATLW